MAPRRPDCWFGKIPMSAPITKDQLTFSLGNMSYVDYSYDEPPAIDVKTPSHGVGHLLSHVVEAFAAWRRRQAVLQEMAMLSDRELADIGLTRADLPRVFDPTFAAQRACGGRDYFGG
jgi:uncharacterized protein YjiS (DUF1127 family)